MCVSMGTGRAVVYSRPVLISTVYTECAVMWDLWDLLGLPLARLVYGRIHWPRMTREEEFFHHDGPWCRWQAHQNFPSGLVPFGHRNRVFGFRKQPVMYSECVWQLTHTHIWTKSLKTFSVKWYTRGVQEPEQPTTVPIVAVTAVNEITLMPFMCPRVHVRLLEGLNKQTSW